MDTSHTLPQPSLSEIRRQYAGVGQMIAEQAQDAHLNDNTSTHWLERRGAATYDDVLPEFESKSFRQHIANLPSGAVWLDHGCGDAARALHEVHQQRPDLVCEGVTYPVDRNDLPDHGDVTVYRQDADQFLTAHQNRYDLITSSQAIRYAPDAFATLKRMYRSLRTGGVLLVDMIYNDSMPLVQKSGGPINPEVIQDYLRKRGYQCEVVAMEDFGQKYEMFSFAIRKSADKSLLKLPVRLVRIPELELSRSGRIMSQFPSLGAQKPNQTNYVYEWNG
jgi:ubiquinone/menaquinone biosynthesis C-methylase UbiE